MILVSTICHVNPNKEMPVLHITGINKTQHSKCFISIMWTYTVGKKKKHLTFDLKQTEHEF